MQKRMEQAIYVVPSFGTHLIRIRNPPPNGKFSFLMFFLMRLLQ